MQDQEHYVYFHELVLLLLLLASPVLSIFCAGAVVYFRKVRGYAWTRAAVIGVVATSAAFALAFGIWVALGHAGSDLPEPIFMIGGIINSPALAASAVVAAVIHLSTSARNERAA